MTAVGIMTPAVSTVTSTTTGYGTSLPTGLIGILIMMECGMSESLIAAVCAELTADGEGLELLAPCYVARQERVIACMGSIERLRQDFSMSFEGSGLGALPW